MLFNQSVSAIIYNHQYLQTEEILVFLVEIDIDGRKRLSKLAIVRYVQATPNMSKLLQETLGW